MSSAWPRERIEKLTPGEVRSLRANALERGAQDVVALCDEVLGAKVKVAAARARQGQPRARHPRLVSRKKAMEMRGVKLHNPRWSWGAIRASDGVAVLTIWADEIAEREQIFETLLWGPNHDGSRPWADKQGGRERLVQCQATAAMGHGEGVLIYGARRGRDLPVDQPSQVEGADPCKVIRFRMELRGDEYWAVWDRGMVAEISPEVAERSSP